MICYDAIIRNSLGDLLQFEYGEDGMDGAFIERQTACVPTFTRAAKAFPPVYPLIPQSAWAQCQ
jgi:hypothetical protein